MTKAHIAARRQKAAEKSIKKRWRQLDINDRIDKPGRLEGIYKAPTLVVRRVRSEK
jgi:hypothetical protein